MPKVLIFGVTSLVLGAAANANLIDDKLALALFTLAGSVLAFTWATSAKLQKFIDRLEIVERSDAEQKKDMRRLQEDMSAIQLTIGSIQLEIQQMRPERRRDTEFLRKQLETAALLETVPGQTERTGLRILIVDDNEQDLKLAVMKLSPTFIVDTCGTLAQAAAKLKRQKVDCVLLDLKLPDARFNRTVEDFTAENPNTLCIVLTGRDDEATRRQCYDQGADDVWIKGQDDRDIRMIKRRITEANWRRHHSQQEKKENGDKIP